MLARETDATIYTNNLNVYETLERYFFLFCFSGISVSIYVNIRKTQGQVVEALHHVEENTGLKFFNMSSVRRKSHRGYVCSQF